MELIQRDFCVYSGKSDLEHLHTIQRFPILMSCTEAPREDDKFLDMDWYISRSTGSLQLNPLLPMNILYDQDHGGGTVGGVWKSYHEKFAKFIAKDQPVSILEIGGGHGHLSKEYRKLVAHSDWCILEPSPRPDEDVKAVYIKGYLEELDHSSLPENLEAIAHSYVIEHAFYPDEMIKNINRLLEVGQMMYVSSPNFQVGLQKKYPNTLNFEHNYYIDEQFVLRLLEMNGFEVKRMERHFEDYALFIAAEKIMDSDEFLLASYPNRYDETKEIFLGYMNYFAEFAKETNKKIEDSSEVFLFGASVFAQMFLASGLKADKIKAILDNDPEKQTKRLYGTNLRILSPQVLKGYKTPTVILRMGLYNEEIKKNILENINPNAVFCE